jgi:hypothetical protein
MVVEEFCSSRRLEVDCKPESPIAFYVASGGTCHSVLKWLTVGWPKAEYGGVRALL